ncbi:MAG: hypothetical protein QG671_3332 [Actinomycetota bacterium]|nr:hypothetical protein [Actinomycetota bacterium]
MSTDRQRHYGEGTVFQRAGDGLWVARLEIGRGPDGRRRRWQAASRTRRGALASLRAARLDREQGRVRRFPLWTVSGWLQHWLESIARPAVRPTTWRDYETVVRRHLIPALGPMRLPDLTAGDVRRMHREATASVSLVTAQRPTGSCGRPCPMPSTTGWSPATSPPDCARPARPAPVPR